MDDEDEVPKLTVEEQLAALWEEIERLSERVKELEQK